MRIHLIGVGGTGMGNLAALLGAMGHEVRGSDAGVYPPMDRILASTGVSVIKGYDPANLAPAPDLVVVGNVCRADHPEARAAIAMGLPVASMAGTLASLVLKDRRPIVVAGTHGKTTTTALVAHLLESAGADPGYLVGGLLKGRDCGARPGAGPWFVVEGDEYDSAFFEKRAKFLSYLPDGVILTSMEHDHVDIYPTWDAYRQAFCALVGLVRRDGCLVACADWPEVAALAGTAACRVLTYSSRDGIEADWMVIDPRPVEGGGIEFGIRTRARGALGRFELPIPGIYNAANATAAIAMCHHHAGVDIEVLRTALPAFGGVARRQEEIGTAAGVTVIDDFGHHPTAVEVTLEALAARIGPGGGRLVAVLRPASATACRATHQDRWAEALARADVVVLAPLARANIPEGERLDLPRLRLDLEARGRKAVTPAALDEIPAVVAGLARPGDTVVFFSNSDTAALTLRTVEALSR